MSRPADLTSLAIGALDRFSRIKNLQDILEVCLDELAQPSAKNPQLRIELLISLYRADMALHLDELRVELEGIFQLARIMAAQIQHENN